MSKNIVLSEDVVQVNISVKNRQELLNFMAKILEQQGYVKNTYADAVVKREEMFSTGLPTQEYCVAIPHTDVIHVNESMISIATLTEPVQFCEMGNPEEKVDVKIVFMLAVKDSESQIELLTKLMKIVQNQDLLKEIYEADKKHLINLVNEKLCI